MITHLISVKLGHNSYGKLYCKPRFVDDTIVAKHWQTQEEETFKLREVMPFKYVHRSRLKREYPEHFDPNF